MTGLVAAVAAVDEVRAFAEAARDLGYEGMMAIHPSHLEVINDVFGVGEEERAAARAVIAALRDGAAAGQGAIVHDGRMVDLAMARAAADVLRAAGDDADLDLDSLFGDEGGVAP
jgi:citrate lyase subunit beta/citryl-CoA lyase